MSAAAFAAAVATRRRPRRSPKWSQRESSAARILGLELT